MNNWGIRKQIIALALLPILVVAIALTSYFTLSQLDFISESQIKHGNTIVKQLAPISEYAVFSGNITSLNSILQNTLLNEDIVAIKITNKDNKTLIFLEDKKDSEDQNSIWHQLAHKELTTFKETIRSQTLDIDMMEDYDIPLENRNDIIGYIELTVTSTNINSKKLQAVTKGGLLSLIILFFSAILALRLSKKISTPVQELTQTVKKISSGNYHARIEQQALGELGILESCVNIMAKKLQHSHDDLETKIEDSLKELHETMEELEIRNVELDISRSNAIQANKAKTEFLASMSHELRTPLGGILGFSELLENTNLEEQQRDYSEIIKKSANNLLYIIDDVLDLSKIESGKLDFNLLEFNIVDIIEEVIDLLIPIAYEKNIELFYYIDKSTPRLIYSDPTRIRQILINLIGNAIKFTDNGHVSLHMSSTQATDNTIELSLAVHDTGIGMTQLQQDRLFEAFTQADKTIEKRFGGTGLGLVISKKLAQLLNGDISFKSQHNVGSTFTLTVSSKQIQQQNIPDNALLDKSICLIDPTKTCHFATQSMLNSWHCKTSTFSTAPDDLSNYDLIIINICKSNMSKDKIKSIIPKNNSDVPLLAIVSTRSHKELKDIKDLGLNDAVFHSAKHEFIRQSALTLINHVITPVKSTPSLQTSNFNWSGLKFLVVDDNEINLKLAEIILKKNGATVSTASNGRQGINLSNEQDFDLIFMDLQMPEIDGYECSQHIRNIKKNENIIIIALTANAMITKDSRSIEQYEINDVLIKPINETVIQNTINQWLFKYKAAPQEIILQVKTELFSKTEALELAAGNSQLANELTNMLINELPEYLLMIDQAFINNDIERLKQQTHKLHGAARCCGTPSLRNLAKQLESDIDNAVLERLNSSTHELTDEIKKLINVDRADLII